MRKHLLPKNTTSIAPDIAYSSAQIKPPPVPCSRLLISRSYLFYSPYKTQQTSSTRNNRNSGKKTYLILACLPCLSQRDEATRSAYVIILYDLILVMLAGSQTFPESLQILNYKHSCNADRRVPPLRGFCTQWSLNDR